MAIDEKINTEGSFEYRIKPKIQHGTEFLNRCIEEIQQIIVTNKTSSEMFMSDFADAKAKIDKMEQDILAIRDSMGKKEE